MFNLFIERGEVDSDGIFHLNTSFHQISVLSQAELRLCQELALNKGWVLTCHTDHALTDHFISCEYKLKKRE